MLSGEERSADSYADAQAILAAPPSRTILAGVCARVAALLGVDAVFVRVVALALVLGSWFSLLLYPVLWWVFAGDRFAKVKDWELADAVRRDAVPVYATLAMLVVALFGLRLEPFATLSNYAGLAAAEPSPWALYLASHDASAMSDSDSSEESLSAATDQNTASESAHAQALAASAREQELAAQAERERIHSAIAAVAGKVIGEAAQAEALARRARDPSTLTRYYAGDALTQVATSIRESDPALIAIHQLEMQRFEQVTANAENNAAAVSLTERWSATVYRRRDGRCLYQVPAHDVPQIIHLAALESGWRIVRIEFGETAEVQNQSCEN